MLIVISMQGSEYNGRRSCICARRALVAYPRSVAQGERSQSVISILRPTLTSNREA